MPLTEDLHVKKPTGKGATSDITVVTRAGRRLRLPSTITVRQRQPNPDPATAKPDAKTPDGQKATTQEVHAKKPDGTRAESQITTKDPKGKQAGIMYAQATALAPMMAWTDDSSVIRWLLYDAAAGTIHWQDAAREIIAPVSLYTTAGVYFQSTDGLYLKTASGETRADSGGDTIVGTAKFAVQTATDTYWLMTNSEMGSIGGGYPFANDVSRLYRVSKSTRVVTQVGGPIAPVAIPFYPITAGYTALYPTSMVVSEAGTVYIVGYRQFWQPYAWYMRDDGFRLDFYVYYVSTVILGTSGDTLVEAGILEGSYGSVTLPDYGVPWTYYAGTEQWSTAWGDAYFQTWTETVYQTSYQVIWDGTRILLYVGVTEPYPGGGQALYEWTPGGGFARLFMENWYESIPMTASASEIVVARGDGSYASFRRSVNNGASWTEIGNDGGQYGNRLTTVYPLVYAGSGSLAWRYKDGAVTQLTVV